MTAAEMATNKAMEYVRSGMSAKDAVRRACGEAVRSGLGDISEGWDTFTTYAPWVAAGVAGIFLYRTGVKVKRAATDYIETRKRKHAAAKAAWDAVL